MKSGFLKYSEGDNQNSAEEILLFDFEQLVYSTVKGESDRFLEKAKSKARSIIPFTNRSRIGLKSNYKTQNTLGADRWANSSAALELYPRRNVCVFDIGTCVKHDVVSAEGEYIGGSIAPGLNMRFVALSEKTAQLPRLQPSRLWSPNGIDTDSSIQSGVMEGILLEIRGRIESVKQQFNNPVFVLTGGDAHFFADKLKNSTFAVPNLTLIGIHTAIKYHEE